MDISGTCSIALRSAAPIKTLNRTSNPVDMIPPRFTPNALSFPLCRLLRFYIDFINISRSNYCGNGGKEQCKPKHTRESKWKNKKHKMLLSHVPTLTTSAKVYCGGAIGWWRGRWKWNNINLLLPLTFCHIS